MNRIYGVACVHKLIFIRVDLFCVQQMHFQLIRRRLITFYSVGDMRKEENEAMFANDTVKYIVLFSYYFHSGGNYGCQINPLKCYSH